MLKQVPGTAFLLMVVVVAGCSAGPSSLRPELLQKELFKEAFNYRPLPSQSEPITRGNYVFNGITEPGQRFPVLTRTDRSGKEITWLDLNLLVSSAPNLTLKQLCISDDGENAAYILNFSQSEPDKIFIQKIPDGPKLFISDKAFACRWDNQNLLFTRVNETQLPQELWQYSNGQLTRIPREVSPSTHIKLSEASPPIISSPISDKKLPRSFPTTLSERKITVDEKLSITLYYDTASFHEPAPVILEAYGAYNLPTPTRYRPSLIPLLTRGIGYGICHVRGSGEREPIPTGPERGEHRKAAINDFADCAKKLQDSVISNKIIAQGRSAGATLVASSVALHPTLFTAAVYIVPQLNLSSVINDPSSPLSAQDREDWFGKDGALNLGAVDPLLLMKPGFHPPVLLVEAENDALIRKGDLTFWVNRFHNLYGKDSITHVLLKNSTHDGTHDQIEDLKNESLINSLIIQSALLF